MASRFARSTTIPLLYIALALTCATHPVRAQSSPTDWEKAAGNKMSFDAASIKQNLEPYPPGGSPPHSNFPLDSADAYSLNGGLLSTTKWPLYVYIGFAYKLTPYANSRVIQRLPMWAQVEHFDIQARAQGAPTKDQMRLMMQSLLADRFKLALHMEAQEMPVFELVEDKPGKFGPNLQPHSADHACVMTKDPAASTSGASPTSFPCGTMSGHFRSGQMNEEGRASTMKELADYLKEMTGSGLDRPVLDHTGLTGAFDFTLEWTPQGTTILVNGATAPLDENGPPFTVALKEQLGLRLDPATAPVDVPIIDHIEEPSPN